MTELSFSNTSNKKNELSIHFFSNFFNFCFSIFSHPLYFFYFLFFSPYLFKLLSFLSPLFITTTLLFVALLTFTPNLVLQDKGSSESSESKWGFLLYVFQTFISWLLSKADDKDEEIGYLDEFEAYLVMFQASIFEVFEPKSVEDCSERFEEPDSECEKEREDFCPMEEANVYSVEKPVQKVDNIVEATKPIIAEVKSLESLFQENAELEDMSSQKKDKEVKKLDPESNKVEESKEKLLSLRSGSKVKGYRDIYGNKVRSNNGDGEYAEATVKVKSQRLEANYLGSPESNWEYSGKVIGNNEALCSNLGSFGSMRVEKEWRRTLACKLFEERHHADGSEGMDMLWETYETESNKVLKKSNTKKGKKGEVEYSEDEEEEEEDMEVGKLCCLQALKFSTGKMNLGMGRPNLLKFSKALKGIGWFHHVGKHGRKGNH